jgi:hypothetical protein
MRRRWYLDKRSAIADIVTEGATGSDTDLILVYGRLGLWLFDSGVSIHGLSCSDYTSALVVVVAVVERETL